MAEAIFMPKQGQSVETCIITQWYKKKGETVNEGEILFSYETDKAAFDEEAKHSGILLDVFYNEGDEVPVLSNVGVIGKAGEDISSFIPGKEVSASSEPEREIPAAEKVEVAPKISEESKDDRIKISPRAKRMAAEHSVDPTSITGSGPNGRIIVRDVEAILTQPQAAKPKVTAPVTVPVAEPAYFDGEISGSTIRPISNIRKIIAKNMLESLRNSAQLTHHITADARKLLALRKVIKAKMETERLENITLNDMVCYAVVQTLRKHQALNAHLLGEKVREFNKVHLGMAVDTERGLMVPALKNADDYSLNGLAGRLKALASDCRNGKIDPELLKSEQGSFTISNLGNYGIEMFTPVLNVPQTGILGVNTITYRPGDIGDGTIGFIPVIGLSLTYDHRAVDGAPASAFLKDLADYIKDFNAEI